MRLKDKRYRNPQLLAYAKGQPCTLNIAGVCRYSNESTVSAHCNFNGGKMGGKTHDHSIAFACYWCHGVIDGHTPYDWSYPGERVDYMARGVERTMAIVLRENPEILLKGRF